MTADDKKAEPLPAKNDEKLTAGVNTVYRETVRSGRASADGRVTTVTKTTEKITFGPGGIKKIDEELEVDASVDGQRLGKLYGSEDDALDSGEALRRPLQQQPALREPNDSSRAPDHKRSPPKPK
jgi:hypothetical protein